MATLPDRGSGVGAGRANARRERGSAFTLVELLIVVAVVSTLVGVVAPAVSHARQAGQAAAASSTVRQLVLAQLAYASRSDGWLAGVNTSGASGLATHGEVFLGDTSPTTPTTTHDWISPALGDELGLPANRAERTWAIFERFVCPRAIEHATMLWGAARDRADFESQHGRDPARQISYLAPSAFHYSPGVRAWSPPRLRRQGVRPKVGWNLPYALPSSWRPRLDRLARPDGKVAVADGTRYLTARRVVGGTHYELDFDVTADPSLYSSFTSSGPVYESSRAYGRSYLPPGIHDRNVDLSMRFYEREMHTGWFDGHVSRMSGEDAWSDPTPWYPRGSVFVGGDATPEVLLAVQTNGWYRKIN